MEFDELKKAWGQFNDKINCQEVVERQQVDGMNGSLWGFCFFCF